MKFILISLLLISCNALKVLTGIKSHVDQGLSGDRDIKRSLQENIEMYFEFNESQSLDKFSSFGNYVLNDATPTGIPLVAAPFGQGLNCGSGAITSQILSLSTNFLTGPSDNLNISFRVRQQSLAIGQGTVIEFNNGKIVLGDAGDANSTHDLILTLQNSPSTFQRSLNDVADLSGGQWVHVSINIFGNDKIEVYSNGGFVGGSDANGVSNGISSAGLSLCSGFAGSNVFLGEVSSFGIWRRTLSDNEIRELADNGLF
jgi:hypothetical protein